MTAASTTRVFKEEPDAPVVTETLTVKEAVEHYVEEKREAGA